jgi:hypothetical protein
VADDDTLTTTTTTTDRDTGVTTTTDTTLDEDGNVIAKKVVKTDPESGETTTTNTFYNNDNGTSIGNSVTKDAEGNTTASSISNTDEDGRTTTVATKDDGTTIKTEWDGHGGYQQTTWPPGGGTPEVHTTPGYISGVVKAEPGDPGPLGGDEPVPGGQGEEHLEELQEQAPPDTGSGDVDPADDDSGTGDADPASEVAPGVDDPPDEGEESTGVVGGRRDPSGDDVDPTDEATGPMTVGPETEGPDLTHGTDTLDPAAATAQASSPTGDGRPTVDDSTDPYSIDINSGFTPKSAAFGSDTGLRTLPSYADTDAPDLDAGSARTASSEPATEPHTLDASSGFAARSAGARSGLDLQAFGQGAEADAVPAGGYATAEGTPNYGTDDSGAADAPTSIDADESSVDDSAVTSGDGQVSNTDVDLDTNDDMSDDQVSDVPDDTATEAEADAVPEEGYATAEGEADYTDDPVE